jgi:predicted DNA-binding transcriptional regulator YafY
MARRQTSAPTSPRAVTGDRAGRLFRTITLLATAPQTREVLTRRLDLDVRGFYRDLELLREYGVTVALANHRYTLGESAESALAKLPFPDPHLSLQEAIELSQGRTGAHRKLKGLIETIVGKLPRAKAPRRK